MAVKPSKENVMKVATLDEAMLLTGFGVFNVWTMMLSGMVLLGMIMQTLGLSYIIPAAQCDLELTQQQKGWLVAIPFIAIILTSHAWGWLADTRGRRPVMMLSMAAAVALTILSSFSPNLAVFSVLTFLACIFISGPSGVAYAYLGELNSIRHRDKMVAFGASFVGIGTVLLPAVSWLILPMEISFPIPFLSITYRSWRLLVVACCIPYFISCIILVWAPESPKFLHSKGQVDKCLGLLKKIYAQNNRMPEDSYPVKSLIVDPSSAPVGGKGAAGVLASMIDQTVPLFKPPLLAWTSLACFVQFGIFATANGFYVWFPMILNSLASHQGNETSICAVLSFNQGVNDTVSECVDTVNVSTFHRAIVVGLIFYAVYITVGIVVDFIGKRVILVSVLSISGIAGAVAHLVSNQQLAITLFAVFQMAGSCIGLLTAVAVELFPTKLRAMAVCLSLMMGRVGAVLGSNVIGMMLQSNCQASFYLFGGLLILCSLLCLMLPGKQSPKETKKITAKPENETHEPV